MSRSVLIAPLRAAAAWASIYFFLALFAAPAAAQHQMTVPPDTPSLYEHYAGAPYTVSFDNRSLVLNGSRVLLQSGSIHMLRSTPDMWPQLFALARTHGINMIDTYVFWDRHEAVEGQIDFSTPQLNISHFVEEAGKAGLLVYLRIGPYVCGEWNYGGIPAWAKFIPGMVFREDNAPWLQIVERFVRAVVAEVEPHLARNGGPIALAQIENEYGIFESAHGDSGKRYLAKMADLARQLDLGVQWIMCAQQDAPADFINTCDGLYCDGWISTHTAGNPGQPHFWTENWNGQFQRWGTARPHRPVEDTNFAVGRFIMLGGSMHSYYMLHGGTSFGRNSGDNMITSYDYDVSINEYGQPNPLKFNQSRTMHAWLAHYSDAILAGTSYPEVLSIGQWQEATVFPPAVAGQPGVAFLANILDTPTSVQWPPNSGRFVALPGWSVSFFDNTTGAVVFNTAKGPFIGDKGVQQKHQQQNDLGGERVHHRAYHKIVLREDDVNVEQTAANDGSWSSGGDDSYSCAPDVFGLWANRSQLVTSPLPQEQINTTRDASDYLLYGFAMQLTTAQVQAGTVSLNFDRMADYFVMKLEQRQRDGSTSEAWAIRPSVGPAQMSFNLRGSNASGRSNPPFQADWVMLYIQSQALGMVTISDNMERFTRGIDVAGGSRVSFDGRDISSQPSGDGVEWIHQVGLMGEQLDYAHAPSNASVWSSKNCPSATSDAAPTPLMWYRLHLSVNLTADPAGVFALDMSGMYKGMVFVNGHAVGRYWLVLAPSDGCAHPEECAPGAWAGKWDDSRCRTGCSQPTQRYYHVPRAWMHDGANEVTIMEEGSGAAAAIQPQQVQLVRRNTQQIL